MLAATAKIGDLQRQLGTTDREHDASLALTALERARCGARGPAGAGGEGEAQIPTQRQSASSQAEMLARVIAVEAQLAASQVQNVKFQELLSQMQDAAAADALDALQRRQASPSSAAATPPRTWGSPDSAAATPSRGWGEAGEQALCGICRRLSAELPRGARRRVSLPAWNGRYLSLPKQELEPEEGEECRAGEGTPAPPVSDSWDWPLSRHEKRERALFVDRQVLMADQRSLLEHIESLTGEPARLGLELPPRPC